MQGGLVGDVRVDPQIPVPVGGQPAFTAGFPHIGDEHKVFGGHIDLPPVLRHPEAGYAVHFGELILKPDGKIHIADRAHQRVPPDYLLKILGIAGQKIAALAQPQSL